MPPNPSGQFKANITLTITPITITQPIKPTQITTPFKNLHPTPIHIRNPTHIPITHLPLPHFPQPVTINQNELPLFSPCALTPHSL
ncbi:D-glutamate cyclase family protein, partial [Staphylococcus saprophyticus]|uniref:D-glutamate cyclase family protein n=1 Tax=Staphylococcus saprophyticus TaxID=29385 RepID=UPI0021B30DDA